MGNLASININKQARISSENCNIYTSVRHKSNDTGFLGLSGFEGIPQNFVINLFSWIVLNMLFIVLRKKAWNYGRMAVMQKEELKWTDMFYGDDVSIGSGGSGSPPPHITHGRNHNPVGALVSAVDSPMVSGSESEHGEALGSAPASLMDMDTLETSTKENGNNNNSKGSMPHGSGLLTTSSGKVGNFSEIKDTGYFSWIKVVFTLTDKQYRDKCGPDCVSYLSFQRHLIFLALIITCCSLLIILPINMHPKRNMSSEQAEFAKTTIINLSNNNEHDNKTSYINFLWAHVVLSIVYLFIGIWVMRHYSKGLQFLEEDSTDVSHTICIIGVNKEKCHENLLRAHLLETYPGTEILEVSFAYNISKLQNLEFQRLSASSAKLYYEQIYNTEREKEGENFKPPTLRPYLCGVMGCCFTSSACGPCRCKETDALEYYTQLEEKYTTSVEKERQKSLTTPLGIAFVTFSTIEAAERIVEDYACSARLLLHTPESKYTKDLYSNHWIVKFAPVPEDIYWENLTLDFKFWYVKFVLINLLLAIIVIIFSTPVFVFTLLYGPKGMENSTKKAETELPIFANAIVDTLPTGIVWVLGVILISLVYQSDALIGFWTKTAGNLSEMIKIFFFLTFMVIVLPALGVTSISYFLNSDNPLSWSCIFYKENGALFVNYVCTSSLTGTAAELMRLPELFVYAVKLCFARSIAEVGAIRKSVLWDFQIGSNYAWMMLHFALFTCFSVIYPLVTPFGLLYLVLKHLVDRYNIYFAYAPCKVEKEVHATAVNFVVMSMFMLQINLLAYVHFYIGPHSSQKPDPSDSGDKKVNSELRALQVISLVGFSVTAALFLAQVCFNVCADFSPIHHFKKVITDQDEVLEVGRASSVQPYSQENRRSHGSKNSRGSQTRKRSTKERHGVAPLMPFNPQSSIQIGVGGEVKIVPISDAPFIPLADQTPSVITNATQTTDQFLTSDRPSIIVSSNYIGCGKPYGRYIPPLLRPEFIRIVLDNQQQLRHAQDEVGHHTPPAPKSATVTKKATRNSHVEVVSEKSKSKKKKRREK